MHRFGKKQLFATFPNRALISSPMARLGLIFLPLTATAGIRTHFSRVAPTWHLKKIALPTAHNLVLKALIYLTLR